MNIKLLLITTLIFLNSCSSISSGNIAPGYAEAFKAIKNIITGQEGIDISPELIESIPYASLSLKIGKGPKGLLILESIRNDEETWVSADGLILITKNGRIIKTAGLDHNLSNFISPSINSYEQQSGEERAYKYYYSYDVPFLINLEVEVNIVDKGFEVIELHNGERRLRLIMEIISNKKIGWKAVNKYWIDEDNFIWKSKQKISPKLPEFSLEVTKKPS